MPFPESQIKEAIEQLKIAHLDTIENHEVLEKIAGEDPNKSDLKGVTAAFKQLNLSKKLANQKNVDFIFSHVSYGHKISWHIAALIKAGEHLVTQENFDKMAPHTCESYMFSNIFNLLNRLTDCDLSTQENFDQMIRYSYSSDQICGVLENLTPFHLATQFNLDLIFSHAEHANEIAGATFEMKRKHLLNQSNFMAVINHASEGENFQFFLLSLGKLANEHNFALMIQNAPFSKALRVAFDTLDTGYEGELATQENLEELFQNAPFSVPLAKGFDILKRNKQLTQKNFDRLMDNAIQAESIAANICGDSPQQEEKESAATNLKLFPNTMLFSTAKAITEDLKKLRHWQAAANRG